MSSKSKSSEKIGEISEQHFANRALEPVYMFHFLVIRTWAIVTLCGPTYFKFFSSLTKGYSNPWDRMSHNTDSKWEFNRF